MYIFNFFRSHLRNYLDGNGENILSEYEQIFILGIKKSEN